MSKTTHLYVAIKKGTMQWLQTACGLGLYNTNTTTDEARLTCEKCKKSKDKYTKSSMAWSREVSVWEKTK
jgi:hypothetical protein